VENGPVERIHPPMTRKVRDFDGTCGSGGTKRGP